ncbi:tandem-95 repeat protein [Paracraurococcus lichenis]|uniref:Tandem-95 repeat protein n=1 Tax=Paracraurococcus lichenis TaxID=3064888 RepID=A0ABT9ED29_9PROT|nr:tandem-95 repeat protein [Paracraurococcus sp. LOR1-02]MDO9713981.1 tandem-95 repeat protein [Paracraurococcus sp. LOR1-02]
MARTALETGALAIRPPTNSDADITLRFAVQTIDGTSTATTEVSATIVVHAVSDTPTVQAADLTGSEDTSIPLTGLGGALTDTDGSETLSFLLTGVPAAARLSAGTQNADGSWTLTPAQLAAASLTPPVNFSGSIQLTLTAVATEARDGAAPARASTAFTVEVNPVVDDGTITGSVTGAEDTDIVLRPTFSTPDTDGSETWSALTRVTGVPTGATLNCGTEVSPGAWDVATADLRAGAVTIRPPANSDVDFTLGFSATLTDTGNGISVSKVITGTERVTVQAVADAPEVNAADVSGLEDQPIALGLGARLTDTDGSEQLSLVLSGVPAGATLSAGTRNPDGTWAIAPADLPALAMTPPRDFSGNITLTLQATSSDHDNSTATTTTHFSVHVEAVADAPTLRVGPALGLEDSAIPLHISGATTDIDGSEHLVGFRITGLPDEAVLRAGGTVLVRQADGSVLVDAAVASTLTVTPPHDSDANFTLQVIAISEEPNGSRAESPAQNLPVQVIAVADAPVWTGVNPSGTEDTAIPLGLPARLSDTDGSEHLSFLLSGLPPGATLNVGTYQGPGRWSLTADEAAVATITPPPDFAGTLQLTVSAISQEQNGGSQAVSTIAFPIQVAAVVDTTDWSATATGLEDQPIALDLRPVLGDHDGSEHLVGHAEVSGIPSGAVLHLADGSTVALSSGACSIAVEQLPGLTITMPHDSDVAARLTVAVTVEDTGGVRATVHGTITVVPAGVADTPVNEVSDIASEGNAWEPLPIDARMTDTDGSETLHVWVRDVPDDYYLSAGTPVGNGTWLLRADDLPGLEFSRSSFHGEVTLRIETVSQERDGDVASVTRTLVVREVDSGQGGASSPAVPPDGNTPQGDDALPSLEVTAAAGQEDSPLALGITVAAHDTSAQTLGLRIEGLPQGASLSVGVHDPETGCWVLRPDELAGLKVIPPHDFSGDITLQVTATSVQADGTVSHSERDVTLDFAAVADDAVITASVAPGSAFEDVPVPLHLAVVASDSSEQVVSITLSGLPAGASIAPAAGIHDNGDGTWSVTPAAVGNVVFVPPANEAGTYSLTVTAVTEEPSNHATASTSQTVTFTVAPVPDAPLASAADVAGREDQPITLDLSASLVDRDGSEALSVVISGLPEGARLSAGVNNGDGSWTLTPTQLPGLTLTPPGNWSGNMALTMQAHSVERATGEAATTEVGFHVAVAGVADTPLVDAAVTAHGSEDQPIGIDIVAQLTDRDGSESLVVVATDVPTGASFSAGTLNPDGSWTIPGAALPGLTFTPPPNFSGTLQLNLAVTAVEADGNSTTVPVQVAVTVDAAADAPILSLSGIQGEEDTAIRLPLAATLTDTDGSESIVRFVVSGLPTGATLSAGTHNSDGSWTLTPDQAADVTLTPPANWSGTIPLSVTAVTQEASNGSEAAATATLPVTVVPVADAPVLTATAATGVEDQSVPLSLTAALTDTDGSESFAAIRVTGLPQGFTLSAGSDAGGGAWALHPADLPGLRLSAPQDWNGTVNLTLEATTQDGASTRTGTCSFAVTLAAVNDAPVLDLGQPSHAMAGQAHASVTSDASIVDVDSVNLGGATITMTGGQAGDRLAFSGYNLVQSDGDTLLGDTGIKVATDSNGQVTLSGQAPQHVYERAIEALSLENDQSGLASGTRSIGITLRDDAGAVGETRVVAVVVDPPPAVPADPLPDPAASPGPATADSSQDGTAPSVAHDVVVATMGDGTGGAVLSAAPHDNDGSPALTPTQATDATLTLPPDAIPPSVAAVAHETSNGSEVPAVGNIPLPSTPVADAQALTVAAVSDPPVVDPSLPSHAVADRAPASVASDAITSNVDSVNLAGATITMAGGQVGDRLTFADYSLVQSDGRTLLGDTGIEVATDTNGHVTLSGRAPQQVYERAIEALALENDQSGLASGTRSIGITLRDDAGAAGETRVVAVVVDPPPPVHADPLPGMAASPVTESGDQSHDATMASVAHDMIVVAMGGGTEHMGDTPGNWTETTQVDGVDDPGTGGWVQVVDNSVVQTVTDHAIDLSQPASGQLQIADGSHVDLTQAERITW